MVDRQPTTSIQRSNRTVWIVTGILCAFVLVVAGYFVTSAYLGQRVDCINSTLRYRQDAIDADHQAEVDKVTTQKAAVALQNQGIKLIVGAKTELDVAKGLALFQAGGSKFSISLDTYLAAVNAADAGARKHPLGQC